MSETPTPDFKQKSRDLIFNSELRKFPTVLELYMRAFGIKADLDQATATIVRIIRTSENARIAKTMVFHYLDELEENI